LSYIGGWKANIEKIVNRELQEKYITRTDKQILAEWRRSPSKKTAPQKPLLSGRKVRATDVSSKKKCSICGYVCRPGSRRLCQDHNHNNGQRRGILCHRCNLGLGYFKDNVKLLKIAIAYLMHWEKQAKKPQTPIPV